MPDSTAARHDDIHAVLRALRDERRRLERLGLAQPLARSHDEIRYWTFLAALHSLPARFRATVDRGGDPCPDAPAR